MKIAIISDTHFGYAWESERANDSFDHAAEAISYAKEHADIILLPGDVFDSRIPKPEILKKAIELLNSTKTTPSKLKIDGTSASTLPIITIHGTHERRSSEFVNPLQIVGELDHVHHLHASSLSIKNPETNEVIIIHGMGGVPEQFAPQALQKYNPQPVPNAHNILMIHQSIENYVFTRPGELKYSDLPDNFDLIINGHIHAHIWESDRQKNPKNLMIVGSTITTQIKKGEVEQPKGLVIWDTQSRSCEFVPLKNQRPVFLLEGEDPEKLLAAAKVAITGVSKKPQLKIIYSGTLPSTEIKSKLSELSDISFFTLQFNSPEKSTHSLSEDERGDIRERGRQYVLDWIKKEYPAINAETMLDLLLLEDHEKALKLLRSTE